MRQLLQTFPDGSEMWKTDNNTVVTIAPPAQAVARADAQWQPTPQLSAIEASRAMNLSARPQQNAPIEDLTAQGPPVAQGVNNLLAGLRINQPPPTPADLVLQQEPAPLAPRAVGPSLMTTGRLNKAGVPELIGKPTAPVVSMPMAPKVDQVAKAAANAFTAQEDLAKAQANEVNARSANIDFQNNQLQAIEQKRLDDEAKKNDQINSFNRQYSMANDELAKAEGTEIGPSNYWSSKNVAGKIFAGIAAMAASSRGDPEFINREIERDVKIQQANAMAKIGKGKQKLKQLDTAYGLMLAIYKDPDIAANAAKIALAEGVARKMDQLSLATKIPEIKANLEAAKVNVLTGAEDRKLKTAESWADINLKKAQAAHLAPGGPSASPLSAKELADQQKAFGFEADKAQKIDAATTDIESALRQFPANWFAAGKELPGRGILGAATESLRPSFIPKPELQQQLDTGVERFILATLRKDSGAVIGKDEIADYKRAYNLDNPSNEEAYAMGLQAAMRDAKNSQAIRIGSFDPEAVRRFNVSRGKAEAGMKREELLQAGRGKVAP